MNLTAVLPSKQAPALEVRPLTIPSPGTGELVVRNRAVAGNPVDHLVQNLGLGVTVYPTVLGSDVADDVAAVGPGVTGSAEGDRVLGFAGVLYTSTGACQTYTVLQATARRHSLGLEYATAPALPLAALTAASALFVELGIHRPLDARPVVQSHDGLLVWGADRLAPPACSTMPTPPSLTNMIAAAKADGITLVRALITAVSPSSVGSTSAVLLFAGGPQPKTATLAPWPQGAPELVPHAQTLAVAAFTQHTDLAHWLFGTYLAQAIADRDN
ncbi:hypothetical protein Q5752_003028 [Cryptotrichosporon argae]